jgi:hypothetical protein
MLVSPLVHCTCSLGLVVGCFSFASSEAGSSSPRHGTGPRWGARRLRPHHAIRHGRPSTGRCASCMLRGWCWAAGKALGVWLCCRHLIVVPRWAAIQPAYGVVAMLGWCTVQAAMVSVRCWCSVDVWSV